MATTMRTSPDGRPRSKSIRIGGSLAVLFTRISLLAPRPIAAEAVKGAVLARHEGNFRKNAEAPLSLTELKALLDKGGADDCASREDAIACYLSGSEGWRDAVKRLGGAFADDEAGLKER